MPGPKLNFNIGRRVNPFDTSAKYMAQASDSFGSIGDRRRQKEKDAESKRRYDEGVEFKQDRFDYAKSQDADNKLTAALDKAKKAQYAEQTAEALAMKPGMYEKDLLKQKGFDTLNDVKEDAQGYTEWDRNLLDPNTNIRNNMGNYDALGVYKARKEDEKLAIQKSENASKAKSRTRKQDKDDLALRLAATDVVPDSEWKTAETTGLSATGSDATNLFARKDVEFNKQQANIKALEAKEKVAEQKSLKDLLSGKSPKVGKKLTEPVMVEDTNLIGMKNGEYSWSTGDTKLDKSMNRIQEKLNTAKMLGRNPDEVREYEKQLNTVKAEASKRYTTANKPKEDSELVKARAKFDKMFPQTKSGDAYKYVTDYAKGYEGLTNKIDPTTGYSPIDANYFGTAKVAPKLTTESIDDAYAKRRAILGTQYKGDELLINQAALKKEREGKLGILAGTAKNQTDLAMFKVKEDIKQANKKALANDRFVAEAKRLKYKIENKAPDSLSANELVSLGTSYIGKEKWENTPEHLKSEVIRNAYLAVQNIM